MKKLIFIGLLLLSLTGYSRSPLSTWQCDEVVITLYDNYTCDVGDLTYNVTLRGGQLMLHLSGYTFLVAELKGNGVLLVSNHDNNLDIRNFITCK